MWAMIPPKFNCPNQYLGPMYTKPKRIWGGILFPYTFKQIQQFSVTDPTYMHHTVDKVNLEMEN